MQKNSTNLAIGLLILVIGLGVGYFVRGNQQTMPSNSHTMPNGSVMKNGGDMGGAMDNMMAGLQGKTGDEFDRAFLAGMVVHHEGAVSMAQAALQNAKHQEIKTMAQDIISAQTAEIQQMKQWQTNWYSVSQ